MTSVFTLIKDICELIGLSQNVDLFGLTKLKAEKVIAGQIDGLIQPDSILPSTPFTPGSNVYRKLRPSGRSVVSSSVSEKGAKYDEKL